ncbi:lactococcin 972 family bacteriocin [Streptomyces sp. NPDC004629]|uniref:lactococcin 972 family bacteriocin n=1 Tax=Streptomyces sp. NPDC004629 TaxID=3364705 RepID=UPI003676F194
MKISGRSVIFAVAGAALAAGGLATPATADGAQLGASDTIIVHHRGDGTQPPPELGDPEEWGEVTFTMDDSSAGSVTPKVIVEVGGGTWSYGWYLTTGGKYCYSNYYHHDVRHGSTVKIAGDTAKDIVGPNDYSNANLTRGAAFTCSTYYSKY